MLCYIIVCFWNRSNLMNLTIYLKKELANKINELSKSLNRSRNSIINEALEQLVKKYESRPWPENFFDFEPVTDVPDFKALRKELTEPPKDPLK